MVKILKVMVYNMSNSFSIKEPHKQKVLTPVKQLLLCLFHIHNVCHSGECQNIHHRFGDIYYLEAALFVHDFSSGQQNTQSGGSHIIHLAEIEHEPGHAADVFFYRLFKIGSRRGGHLALGCHGQLCPFLESRYGRIFFPFTNK